MAKTYPTVLIIAGSDPIGGAGIQADIKTCTALGVYAMTAITALTAQNTQVVRAIHAVPPDFLREQLIAVLDDLTPDAIKIGMIPDPQCAEVIYDIIAGYNLMNIVTDPVMVATSGGSLSTPEAVDVIKKRILGASTIITPNLPEAETILGHKIQSAEKMKDSAEELIELYGCDGAVLKGGHFNNNEYITDYIAVKECGHISTYHFTHSKIKTKNTHGTGCTLSSAIASHLALGYNILEATARSIFWLNKAILSGKDYIFGHGHGPVNHMYCISSNQPINK